jgi:hypothetical protein
MLGMQYLDYLSPVEVFFGIVFLIFGFFIRPDAELNDVY